MNCSYTFKILAITLLIATTSTIILPRNGFTDASIYKDDHQLWNLNEIFNTEKILLPGKFSKNVGRTFAVDEPLYAIDYFKPTLYKLNYMKWLHHDLIGLVYDGNQVSIQQMELDGHFGTVIHRFSLWMPDQELVCHDMTINTKRNLLYVGCAKSGGSQLMPGNLFVFEFDLKTGERRKYLRVYQNDGFRIMHRLQMKIIQNPQSSNSESEYLVVYDQGFSRHRKTTENQQFRLFAGLESGSIVYRGLVQLPLKLEAFYDIFPYQTGFIITGRQQLRSEVIALTSCRVDASRKVAQCTNRYQYTSVTNGWVGLTNTDQFVTLNIDNQLLQVYDVEGDVHDAHWMRHKSYSFQPFAIYDNENIGIRDFVGNKRAAMINWVNGQHPSDHGLSISDIGTNITTTEYLVGTLWHDELVSSVVPQIVGQTYLFMFKQSDPGLLVTENSLKAGSNQVVLGGNDSSGAAKVTAKGEIFYWTSPFQFVEVEDKIPSVINMKAGDVIPLPGYSPETSIIKGNAVTARPTFNDFSHVLYETRDQFELNVQWSPADMGSRIKEVVFIEGSAVVQGTDNTLSFFACQRKSIAALSCSLQTTARSPLRSGFVLQNEIRVYKNLVFVWARNAQTSAAVFYIYDTSSPSVSTHVLDSGAVQHVHMGFDADARKAWVAVTYRSSVEFFWVDPRSSSQLTKFQTLTQQNSGYEYFCPQKVLSCPKNPKGQVFMVLSVCETDQRIFKYNINGLEFMNWVPINLSHKNPSFCTTGPEFQIYSAQNGELFGLNNVWDQNIWSFPTKDMGITKLTQVSCIPELEMVVAVGTDARNRHQIATFRGNQAKNFNRRISQYYDVQDYSPTRVENFGLKDGVLNVLHTRRGVKFHFSLKHGPQIFLIAKKSAPANFKVKLSLTFETPEAKTMLREKHISIGSTNESQDIDERKEDTQNKQSMQIEKNRKMIENLKNIVIYQMKVMEGIIGRNQRAQRRERRRRERNIFYRRRMIIRENLLRSKAGKRRMRNLNRKFRDMRRNNRRSNQ